MRVGFIGLGAMGRPMALRLLASGHELAVWARRAESLAPLVAAGAVACVSPAAVAARCEVVFTIVTSGADVAAIALGEQGLVHGLAADSVLVDMSTIAPAEARRLAAELAKCGVHLIDAPVSGGVVGAQDGTLAIMAGGEAAVLARVRPLLECLGRTLVHVGPSGAGQVAKACNQMVMVAAIEACAEALHLAAAAGVDGGRVRQALAGGSAASRVLDVFGGRMVAGNFAAGVEARLHHKDFAVVMQEAHNMRLALPLAGCIGARLNMLMARGWGHDDTSRLLSTLQG